MGRKLGEDLYTGGPDLAEYQNDPPSNTIKCKTVFIINFQLHMFVRSIKLDTRRTRS